MLKILLFGFWCRFEHLHFPIPLNIPEFVTLSITMRKIDGTNTGIMHTSMRCPSPFCTTWWIEFRVQVVVKTSASASGRNCSPETYKPCRSTRKSRCFCNIGIAWCPLNIELEAESIHTHIGNRPLHANIAPGVLEHRPPFPNRRIALWNSGEESRRRHQQQLVGTSFPLQIELQFPFLPRIEQT